MSTNQPTNFIYQQKNQNFPQFHQTIATPRNNQIGRILAKYHQKQIQHSNQNNIIMPRKQSQQHNNNKNNNLSVIRGINYSQIYNDIKIDKQPYVINNQLYRKQQDLQNNNNHTDNNSEQKINKLAYNFQSAQQMRNKGYQRMNKKMLPGIIMHSNKNNDVSFQSSQHQLLVDETVNVGKYRNRQFRISDKNQKRPYFNQVSEDNVNMNGVNQNGNQYQFDHLTHADISVNNIMYSKSGRSQLKNQDNQTSEMVISRQNYKKKQSKAQQKVLANSRSIGVGNYRIQKQDLYKQIDINEQQINNSPNIHKKTPNAMPIPVSTPRYSKQNNQQNQKYIQLINYNTKAKNIEQDINTHNPQYNKQKISEEKLSSKKHIYQLLQNVHLQPSNINSNGNGNSNSNKQISKQITTHQSRKQKQKQKEQQKQKSKSKSKSKSKQKIIYYDKQYIQSSSLPTFKQLLQVKQDNVNEHISIQVSRVASTIKPIANLQINQLNINIQSFHDNQEDNHTHTYKNQHEPSHQQQQQNQHEQMTGQISSNNMIQILHSTSTKKQHLPQQHRHQNLNKQDYIPTFNIDQYSKIYTILKTIQTQLKKSILNVQQILKCIKTYLQIIAIGNLDNIDQFDLPLHKKKIIKNSLFLQRVAVIILAFSYTTHTIKQSLKYLQNILGYSINNCLILIKILKQTQINQLLPHNNNNNTLSNNVIQKSDRLVMKRNLDTLRNNNNVLLDAVQKLSKGQQIFYQNLSQIIKLISKASLEQTFYSLLEYFAFFLCVTVNDHMIPFLAVAPNPYLSPVLKNSKYTLVIDVIQLFCYSKKQSKTNIFRPYTQHFLHQMSQYYQLISFCPMFPSQIDKVIDMLDPKRYISSRLYKHHTINNNQNSMKYLDRIGRNMDEMILLDNENIGGLGSYQNCIHVPMWKGSKNDTFLAELCPLLAMIALKRVPVQQAVKKIRQQLLKNKKEGVKYINFGISLD